MNLPRPQRDGRRRHPSNYGFRSPRFPDLHTFSRFADNLLHRRHEEPLRSPGSHPDWHFVPPPYCYGPPPPPPPPLYSSNSPHFAKLSAPAREIHSSPQNAPTAQQSVMAKSPAPSAPSSEEEWSKSNPAPSAPPVDQEDTGASSRRHKTHAAGLIMTGRVHQRPPFGGIRN